MKWTWRAGVVILAVSAVANAQSGRNMDRPKMGDKMGMGYTGCIEDVNHGAWFLLTYVGDDHQTMAHHDAMMKSDAEAAAKDESSASNDMHGDHMMAGAVVLIGRSDLRKHVGQKVTVTGSLSHGMSEATPNDRDTLTVASLKVVAKSCS